MKKIVYSGPLPSGWLRTTDGRDYDFERGKPIEVTEKHASEILQNSEWKEVETL